MSGTGGKRKLWLMVERLYEASKAPMDKQAFFWALPALMALTVGLQLRYRRIVIGWTSNGWSFVEKTEDEGRFWLFIVAESAVVLILIGQALST